MEVKSGVGVVVLKDNKVLVGLRKGSHGEGLWALPGGHIEAYDSSLKECGEREVLEETGIICEMSKPDGVRDDLFSTFDILSEDGTKRYITVYLFGRYISGGEFISENSIKGLEEDKCNEWHWKTVVVSSSKNLIKNCK